MLPAVLQTRILLVDDVSSDRMLICKSLRVRGYTNIIEVGSGGDAMEAYQASLDEKNPIELVLLDYGMPEMDGLATAECLRSIRSPKQLFIVGFTERSLKFDVRDKFLSSGADEVLTKPLDVDAMAALIEKCE